MKNVPWYMLLSCCFITVFAGILVDAHSHEKTTARDASTGDMDDMRNFAVHMKEHAEQLRSTDEHAAFRAALKTDNGEWKHGDTYVIWVEQEDAASNMKPGESITFHAEHSEAQGGSLRHIQVFEQLMTGVEGAGGEPYCVQDPIGEHGNHICAVHTTITGPHGTSHTFIFVVGFRHKPNEVQFPDDKCPSFSIQDFGEQAERGTDSEGEEFIRTSADMVRDEKSLENYLKTIDEHIADEFSRASATPGLSAEELRGLIFQKFIELRPCWRTWPWKDRDIYFYIMTQAGEQFVIFNGLNPELEERTLRLYDGCIDVGRGIFDILEKQSDGFLEYHWSNPLKDDDKVVDESGNIIPGLSPGTSVKLGYFLRTTFSDQSPIPFALGSGIYPEKEYYVPESGMCQPIPEYLSETAREYLDRFPVAPQDDGGGCAIASGTQSKVKVVALNLSLIAAVLFLAISMRSRSDR